MPRANRYFLPGKVYHLTHRCHNGQFLLKFARDRDAYREKLRQAVSQFRFSLLDYSVTSNHVHLEVHADETEQISEAMQMVQGEFAQEYNRRKQRTGAYWSDRFHATAIEPDGHLEQCMAYIDLNMFRCGVVNHPREWSWCGYHELMGNRRRYRILDLEKLLGLLGHPTLDEFRRHYEELLKEKIAKAQRQREPQWTESIAVGSRSFVQEIEAKISGRQRFEIAGSGEDWILREAAWPYLTAGRRSDRGGSMGAKR